MTVNTFTRTMVLVLPLSFAAVLSTRAAAAEPDNVPRIVVSYNDLNLDHPEGISALYARLHTAANSVCQTMPSSDPFEQMKQHACFEKALAAAIAKIGNPNLTAYSEKRPMLLITAKN